MFPSIPSSYSYIRGRTMSSIYHSAAQPNQPCTRQQSTYVRIRARQREQADVFSFFFILLSFSFSHAFLLFSRFFPPICSISSSCTVFVPCFRYLSYFPPYLDCVRFSFIIFLVSLGFYFFFSYFPSNFPGGFCRAPFRKSSIYP